MSPFVVFHESHELWEWWSASVFFSRIQYKYTKYILYTSDSIFTYNFSASPRSSGTYPNCFRKVWNISQEPAYANRVRYLCPTPDNECKNSIIFKFHKWYQYRTVRFGNVRSALVVLCAALDRDTGWRCGGCGSRTAVTTSSFEAAAAHGPNIATRSFSRTQTSPRGFSLPSRFAYRIAA